MGANRVAVYPGTFDPVTNGHVDIITRATKVADKLVIGLGEHATKTTLFPVEQRLAMIRAEIEPIKAATGADIEVQILDSLLTEFVDEVGASIIIRGLRAVSDFDYELQMAGMNARLNPKVDTVFLMASEANLFIASSLVREVARLGGDVSSLVSPRVAENLAKVFSE
ncbi:MAG: pantetheine-phosphate adenylyltransferase [Alphaproteobacteria bacterium]|nr:pantetheine-phosphate adenylyltransferase [Alphaproteobacteria bacterium]MBT4711194.1 pantetheine-phosphate adenylyltransferase [Alphaproteobacteria bacterium]MBT5860456.1 pantetheine-phosphate adenylyltransferase [Alphaproteobacteria bacterium]